MAFRILNEEELQLLAGEQREQYEKELDIYRKRAAFVEQMEKYENADIRPFRPKLDFIAPAAGPEIGPYRPREYKVKLQEPSARPEAQLHFTKLEVMTEPELPEVDVNTADSRDIGRIEKPAPVLPDVPGPAKTGFHIKEFGEVCAVLPETPQAPLSDPREIRMENIHVHASAAAPPPPKMAGLPENFPAEFKRPEAVLPDVDVPRQDFPAAGSVAEHIEINLPDVPAAGKAPEPAAMPELKISALPVVAKPEIRQHREFGEIKVQLKKTEDIPVPEVRRAAFTAPDVRAKGLPATEKADVKIRNFRTPEISAPQLETVRIKVPEVNPLQAVQVKKAEAPEVKSAAVRQIRFQPVSADITPGEAVKIPDAHAALAKFFEKNTEKEHEGTLV